MQDNSLQKPSNDSLTMPESQWQTLVTEILLKAALLLGKELMPGETRLWCQSLQGRSAKAIESAFSEHGTRSPYWPKPAEIFQILNEKAERDYAEKQFKETEKRKAEADLARSGYKNFLATPEGKQWLLEQKDWIKKTDAKIAKHVHNLQRKDRQTLFIPTLPIEEERKFMMKHGARFDFTTKETDTPKTPQAAAQKS